jgi:hypothetical protein
VGRNSQLSALVLFHKECTRSTFGNIVAVIPNEPFPLARDIDNEEIESANRLPVRRESRRVGDLWTSKPSLKFL